MDTIQAVFLSNVSYFCQAEKIKMTPFEYNRCCVCRFAAPNPITHTCTLTHTHTHTQTILIDSIMLMLLFLIMCNTRTDVIILKKSLKNTHKYHRKHVYLLICVSLSIINGSVPPPEADKDRAELQL